MLKDLGQRIRAVRKEKGVTLIELAAKTGVAQATLSRIETGTMTGTVDSHEKIAEALGVGLADLYASVDKRVGGIAHTGQDKPRKVTHHAKGVQVELLTQEGTRKKILPLLITLSAGSKTGSETHERGVEKFFFVLDGEARARVEQQDYLLKTGDTLYFDASLPHSLENTASKATRIVCAISPAKI